MCSFSRFVHVYCSWLWRNRRWFVAGVVTVMRERGKSPIAISLHFHTIAFQSCAKWLVAIVYTWVFQSYHCHRHRKSIHAIFQRIWPELNFQSFSLFVQCVYEYLYVKVCVVHPYKYLFQ